MSGTFRRLLFNGVKLRVKRNKSPFSLKNNRKPCFCSKYVLGSVSGQADTLFCGWKFCQSRGMYNAFRPWDFRHLSGLFKEKHIRRFWQQQKNHLGGGSLCWCRPFCGFFGSGNMLCRKRKRIFLSSPMQRCLPVFLNAAWQFLRKENKRPLPFFKKAFGHCFRQSYLSYGCFKIFLILYYCIFCRLWSILKQKAFLELSICCKILCFLLIFFVKKNCEKFRKLLAFFLKKWYDNSTWRYLRRWDNAKH